MANGFFWALLALIAVSATVALAGALRRPNWAGRSVRRAAAIISATLLCALLIVKGAFNGDPDDREGLTYVLRPLSALFLVILQYWIGTAVAWLVLRKLRPTRGYIE